MAENIENKVEDMPDPSKINELRSEIVFYCSIPLAPYIIIKDTVFTTPESRIWSLVFSDANISFGRNTIAAKYLTEQKKLGRIEINGDGNYHRTNEGESYLDSLQERYNKLRKIILNRT